MQKTICTLHPTVCLRVPDVIDREKLSSRPCEFRGDRELCNHEEANGRPVRGYDGVSGLALRDGDMMKF